MLTTQLVHTGSVDALPDLIQRAETTLLQRNTFPQCIFIGTRPLIRRLPTNTKINFDNSYITPSTHVKNLGVIMDCHLNFDLHIQEMYKESYRTLIIFK